MSNKQEQTRTFHPEPVRLLGLEVCVTMLKVAHDLRSGAIPHNQFDMTRWHCGTSHCIGGWVDVYMDCERSEDEILRGLNWRDLFFKDYETLKDPILQELFYYENPNNPEWAAAAIEVYLFEHDPDPWYRAKEVLMSSKQ